MTRWIHWTACAGLGAAILMWSGCAKDRDDEDEDTYTVPDVDAQTDPEPDVSDDPDPDPDAVEDPDPDPEVVEDPDVDPDPDPDPDTEPDGPPPDRYVEPLYPTSGALWNDYVKNDGTVFHDGTDTACNGDLDASISKDECLHGGELRVFETIGFSSCSGVTASDSENAFDWICDDSGSTVRVISTGLRDGMYLSDLIQWTTDPPGWKQMTVTATDGSVSDTSDPSAWWTNPIVEDNDGGWVSTASDIIVITAATPGGDYSIGTDKMAIVAAPGVTLPGGDTGGAVITAAGYHFIWVEADIDATSDNYGVGMVSGGSNFTILRRVTVDGSANYGIWVNGTNNEFVDISVTGNAWEGIRVSGSYNEVRNVTATGNRTGVQYSAGEGNLVENVVTTDNSSDGLSSGASMSTFRHIVSANNVQHGVTMTSDCLWYDVVVRNCGLEGVGDGVHVAGSRNTIAHVQVSNVDDRGIALSGDNVVVGATLHNLGQYGVQQAPGDVVIATTVANANERGMPLGAAVPPSMTTLMNVVILNSGGGFSTDADAGTYLFIDMAVTDNTDSFFTDVNVDPNNTDVTFSGHIIVTDASTSCHAPGDDGINSLCIPQPPSDATMSEGSVAGSFIGAPVTDGTNAHGGSGTQPYGTLTDWLEFDRPLRGWGLGVGALPTDTIRGKCVAGQTCQIVDLNMPTGSSSLLGIVTIPTGSDYVVHHFAANSTLCGDFPGSTWNGTSCEITFLRSAYELLDDDIGNENGLCESNETCVVAHNIGSYQGHGTLVSAGTIGTGATIENVELLVWDTNGY